MRNRIPTNNKLRTVSIRYSSPSFYTIFFPNITFLARFYEHSRRACAREKRIAHSFPSFFTFFPKYTFSRALTNSRIAHAHMRDIFFLLFREYACVKYSVLSSSLTLSPFSSNISRDYTNTHATHAHAYVKKRVPFLFYFFFLFLTFSPKYSSLEAFTNSHVPHTNKHNLHKRVRMFFFKFTDHSARTTDNLNRYRFSPGRN